MALTKDLAIYKDNYTLCKVLLEYMKNVSKILRYGEYNVCLSKAFECLDLLRRINSDFNTRIPFLHQYILLLDDIYNRISLFVEAKFISIKKGTNIIYLVDSLQKQATGWLKHAKSQNCRGKSNASEQSFKR